MNITAQLAQALRACVSALEPDHGYGYRNCEGCDALKAGEAALAAYDDTSRPLAVGDRVRVLRSDYPRACPVGMESEIVGLEFGHPCIKGTRQSDHDSGGWIFTNPSAELERIA